MTQDPSDIAHIAAAARLPPVFLNDVQTGVAQNVWHPLQLERHDDVPSKSVILQSAS
jgi:hypothetical protein